jgi:hypothetical protein
MDLDLDIPRLRALLEDSLGVPVQEEERSFFADLGDDDQARGPSVDEVQRLLSILHCSELDGEAALYTPKDLEVLVREEGSFPGSNWFRRGRSWPLQLQDPDRGLKYTLGPPSDHFTVFLAYRIPPLNRRSFLARRTLRRPRSHVQGDLLEPEREQLPYTLLDAVRDTMPRMHTLRIQSEKELPLKVLQSSADAFAFQVAYNLDTAFVSVRSMEEVIRRTNLQRIRRIRPEELDPPRRSYASDLVYHYQLAIATDSAPLEYLCYYHIAEHWFEAIFEDDLVAGVRTVLTHPDFSFRRKQDVQKLVLQIKDRLKFQREDVTFSEQEALRLVLTKYVDLRNVCEKLKEVQETLISYYAANKVSFAKGDEVNFQSDDAQQVTAALSRRVYKTRNAVVHSKEGGKPRYQPFRHDRELAQELPLMRLIAEEIIVNSATLPS